MIARSRHRLHHRLQRGRKQERVRHAVALEDLERELGSEAPLQRDDLAPEVERRQQRIHQAAGPRPVGGRPEHGVVLREPVLAADEPGQVADQRAVRDQRSLRRSGRSARVDEHRGIVGARRLGSERRPLAADEIAPIDIALPRGGADRDDRRKARTQLPRRAHVRDAALVDDRERRLAVADAVLERVGAEQHRERHRDRAEAIERDVRDRGLEALRQHERDAVAAGDAEHAQRRREAVGGGVDLAVGEIAADAVLVLEADRDRVGLLPRPARAADFGDVEVTRNVPAKAGVELAVAIDRSAHSGSAR
jgi:hypothetical protein